MPKVSVLMPIYNTRPEHLREAVQSVLSQTFADFELIILNDGSTVPELKETVRAFSDPRIVYVENERNLGISRTRNRLMDMARGEYLAVMDHDDVSLPERLEKQVAFLDAHPEVGVLGCQFSTMDRPGVSRLPLDDVTIKEALLVHCGDMCHPATMLRRSVLVENGIRYEEMFTPAEDHALFCRLIPHTVFAALPDRLFVYRSWSGNTSHKRARSMEAAKQGVLCFARRDNPELWAMARANLMEIRRYRLLGLPMLTRTRTYKETRWLLFNFLPLWTGRTSLPHITGRG